MALKDRPKFIGTEGLILFYIKALISIGQHWESSSGAKCHLAHKIPFTAKEGQRVKSMSGVSPRTFPIANRGNAGEYYNRENWSETQIPAPPVPLFRGLGKEERHSSPSHYLAHQPRKVAASKPQPHRRAPGTAAFSLVQPQQLMVLWHGFLQASSESKWNIGLRMSQTRLLGPFLSNVFILSKLYLIGFHYCCF